MFCLFWSLWLRIIEIWFQSPVHCIVGDLSAYSPLWGENKSLFLGLGQPWPCLNPFPLWALLFEIAFHLQLVLLSYLPIFLRPCHFLKLVSFLGANRTKSAYVCHGCWGAWIQYNTIQLRATNQKELLLWRSVTRVRGKALTFHPGLGWERFWVFN